MYELALKRNLQVHFEKIAEEGPPHLKHYSIKLVVGKQDGNNDEEADRLVNPNQSLEIQPQPEI